MTYHFIYFKNRLNLYRKEESLSFCFSKTCSNNNNWPMLDAVRRDKSSAASHANASTLFVASQLDKLDATASNAHHAK